jgi:hypothetical protein
MQVSDKKMPPENSGGTLLAKKQHSDYGTEQPNL